ncbi:hypothetical protein CUC08_Gglean000902 [Alternaria sp. MG1]|nr:hypothetical protein CUC08_Gglean000902 [Alternaria sp. MG1]
MAVFLGPRQITASEREAKMKPSDMQDKDPIFWPSAAASPPSVCSVVLPSSSPTLLCVANVCSPCTSTGIQPPGACLTFSFSIPKKRGILGPVKSISKTPTECPCNDRVRASWVVTLDFPTPPLPESTRRMFRMLSRGMARLGDLTCQGWREQSESWWGLRQRRSMGCTSYGSDE